MGPKDESDELAASYPVSEEIGVDLNLWLSLIVKLLTLTFKPGSD